MTETSLKIVSEIVLPPELKSTEYSSDNVKNLIEMQTLEKAYRSYPASTLDASTISWNLTSLSGGAIIRELEVEIPIKFSITFKGLSPSPPALGSATAAVGQPACTFQFGSPPRPFMTELNCLDSFPLSKLFSSREYNINSSSTLLKENFTVGQIDAMSAQLDLKKCENAGLCLFADSNSHFKPLSAETGGWLLPLAYSVNKGNATSILYDWTSTFGAEGGTYGISMAAQSPSLILNPETRYASNICDSWQAKRNAARNIKSSSLKMTYAGIDAVTSTTVLGCGSNEIPVNVDTPYAADYNTTQNLVCEFEYIVREQILSQFWDHEYAFNKFSWNKILPASSLNIKFQIDKNYLETSILKIGDDIATMVGIIPFGGVYSVSLPTIGTTREKCKLYLRQMKIPLALLPKEAYKVLYYAQERPQAPLLMSVDPSTVVYKADMRLSNLAQIPEYLLLSLPIDKKTTGVISTSPYTLPSSFNLPITKLELTFNQDINIASYQLDMHQLQQFTMENLQNNEYLRNLIVGENKHVVENNQGFQEATVITNSGPVAFPDATGRNLFVSQKMAEQMYATKNCRKTNGISNSSFYLLKIGTQIRLPEGYAPGMIVNHNFEVKAECDCESSLLRPQKDMVNDMVLFTDPDVTAVVNASLDVVNFNKRLFTLSGDSLQQVYIHNIQITSGEFLAIRNEFQANFSNMDKTMISSAEMMIGGGFFSNLKDKAATAFKWLKPRVLDDALKTGRDAVDFGKKLIGDESSLRKYVDMADKGLSFVGHGERPAANEVTAGSRNRRTQANKSAAVDWKKYASGL